jgi:hypothetical protein
MARDLVSLDRIAVDPDDLVARNEPGLSRRPVRGDELDGPRRGPAHDQEEREEERDRQQEVRARAREDDCDLPPCPLTPVGVLAEAVA